ncbi:hypothetical protein RUM43_011719 [Polyplax serrata]|uniref:Uncharacterized protein n=1 Tax=Polyplax serrata TaxID=468196 RepID=A0AAN8P5M1_POLSC
MADRTNFCGSQRMIRAGPDTEAQGKHAAAAKEISNETKLLKSPVIFKRTSSTNIFLPFEMSNKTVKNGDQVNRWIKTAHDDVDQGLGRPLAPPTKRVKKILPPFEKETLEITSQSEKRGTVTNMEVTRVPEQEQNSTFGIMTTEEKLNSDLSPETNEEATGGVLPAQESPSFSSRLHIRGTRLDYGIQEEEPRRYGTDEGEILEKSIWDLLKERKQVDADKLDENLLEGSKNKSTGKLGSNGIYDHFDSDSTEIEAELESFKRDYSNVEKHEYPISFALPWLQAKEADFEVNNPKEISVNSTGHETAGLPQDVSRMLRLSEDRGSVTVTVINSEGRESDRRPSRWYLLLLTGNSTIVQLRRQDFTKYLKLNLAARLSVEYDDVCVNRVILAPPRVLVNVSVLVLSDDVAEDSQLDFRDKFGGKGEASLYKLAESNATLLELSGEEYHVVHFVSLDSKGPEAEAHRDSAALPRTNRGSDAEFIAYTLLGTGCACLIILSAFIAINRYFRKVSDSDWPWLRAAPSGSWKVDKEIESHTEESTDIQPAIIYSGGLPKIRRSWVCGIGHSTQVTVSTFQSPSGNDLESSLPQREQREQVELPSTSQRRNKLQIYNCPKDSLVIPMPFQGDNKKVKHKREDTTGGNDRHPLDVRIHNLKHTSRQSHFY